MASFNELVESRANNTLEYATPPNKNNPFAYPELVNNTRPTPPSNPNERHTNENERQTAFKKNETLPTKFMLERARINALKEKVNVIQLSLVMQMLGALGNQNNNRLKWKIPEKGNISVTGQKWWNLQLEEGGFGAVSLVMHAKDMKYPLAVQWLADQFDESIDSDEIKASVESMQQSDTNEKIFTPPAKVDKNISFVKHYLRFTRKIPEKLLDDLIGQGRIYADEYRNCVFATEGIAELRSSFDGPNSVKKLVPGSTRKKGFIALPDPIKNERILAICESSIDAMSYRALNEGRAAISAAGANRVFPRALAEESLAHGFKVVAAFDADDAGDKASQALFNHFYLKFWIKHKLKNELNLSIDEEALFKLFDTRTISFNLNSKSDIHIEEDGDDVDDVDEFDSVKAENDMMTNDTDNHSEHNLLFFNQDQPFENEKFPPKILVTIKKNDLGIPQCKDFPIDVTEKSYKYITEILGLSRDRPKEDKDWNEILKKKSDLYLQQQNKSAP